MKKNIIKNKEQYTISVNNTLMMFEDEDMKRFLNTLY
jgi:hypothetical protein